MGRLWDDLLLFPADKDSGLPRDLVCVCVCDIQDIDWIKNFTHKYKLFTRETLRHS